MESESPESVCERLTQEVAALFYTLFETAKLSRVDPRAYVTNAAVQAIRSPGTVTLRADLT